MKRRKFLSSLAAIPAMPILLQSCISSEENYDFPIYVHNDRETGHLLFSGKDFAEGGSLTIETLIVGGGIAGLSAASSLPHQDYLVCELSDRLGGTSASVNYKGLSLAQGAHYDLEYPDGYGEDVIALLEKSGTISYEKWKNSWRFNDKQYIIPHEVKNQCFEDDKFRSDVLAEGALKEQFLSLMQQYAGVMPMPTRLIEPAYHTLNDITFVDFLKDKLPLTQDFIRGLDYHMMDDWGGTAGQVSALAGIHYFQCRPYYKEINQLFSPPQGNDYFVGKLSNGLNEEQLKTRHLVKRLTKSNNFWLAEVVDVEKQVIHRVTAKNVIYAGQKHALKYVLPDYAHLFESNRYAPWMVMNFVLKNPLKYFGFWQNEMLVSDKSFLGFIDSSAQHNTLQERQVLTAYYCLPEDSRRDLVNTESQKGELVRKTITYLDRYFGKTMTDRLEAVFINAMGHAMPIPVPGYLLNDKNKFSANDGLAFAGVDHNRLPLLFEAIDSGIEAVRAIYPKYVQHAVRNK